MNWIVTSLNTMESSIAMPCRCKNWRGFVMVYRKIRG